MIHSIAHPTDLSPEGAPAFEHALRLALVNSCELALLHVARSGATSDWDSFPRVRRLLERWGYLRPGAPMEDVLPRTGVAVTKVSIASDDVVDGLARYLGEHRPDLIVAASHGGAGLGRLLNGSVSARIAGTSLIPTMIFGPAARPFVDSKTGSLDSIETVLVAVDHDPPPGRAVRRLVALASGLDVRLDFIHVGTKVPVLRDAEGVQRPIRLLSGPVIETLLEEARRVSLLAMPMAGRDGLIDALRGSTSERVLSEATCPVLALPVG